MFPCFGRSKSRAPDEEALLSEYEDDTVLQRKLHQKLHSYQMLQAMRRGYMPSNEQIIINLRTLLSARILNPDNPQLSRTSKNLVKDVKSWLSQFIDLLVEKNSEDQLQDLFWYMTKARVSIDAQDLINTATSTRARADTQAIMASVQTVGSLLFTNSDFRIFMGDIGTIFRQVFSDTAAAASDAAEKIAQDVKPSGGEISQLKTNGQAEPPTSQDLQNQVADITSSVASAAKDTGLAALESAQENVSGEQKQAMLNRLKQAVGKLRQRNDYSDSVSTITQLIQRYAKIYSRAASDTISKAQVDVQENDAMDQAAENAWSLLCSFGDSSEWDKLKQAFQKLMGHTEKDPEMEQLMKEISVSAEKMLTDPDFYNSAGQNLSELSEKVKQTGTESSLSGDVSVFFSQVQRTISSVLNDKQVSALFETSFKIAKLLSPTQTILNPDLTTDSLQVFIPMLISAIQYIPIPRIEVSTPDIDLLLENLIIEPGVTINHSSFLPYRLKVETYNDVEIRRARQRTISTVKSLITLKIEGLSFRAEEIGFWLRAHSGWFLRLADEGIASFELDHRGIDIALDIELGKAPLEQLVTLNDVRVTIHHLSYTLRQSKFACLAWLFKPLLRPLLRKALEAQLAAAIADVLHAANRELLYARERLRATRIADPQDLGRFVRAVLARFIPEEDPDLYTRVGVGAPSRGVFAGVYAPGSLVKTWQEEAEMVDERVSESRRDGWRNEIFDVQTSSVGAMGGLLT